MMDVQWKREHSLSHLSLDCCWTLAKMNPSSSPGSSEPRTKDLSTDRTAIISKQINALVSKKNSLCCLSTTVVPSQEPRVQEVMSVCVPVRDKSDIPTKPFPKINKQTLPSPRARVYVCVCACVRAGVPACVRTSSHVEFPVSFCVQTDWVSVHKRDVEAVRIT